MKEFQIHWPSWSHFKIHRTKTPVHEEWGDYYDNYLCFSIFQWHWWSD